MLLREHRWAYIDAFWQVRSSDMALSIREESVFLAATITRSIAIKRKHNA